MYSQKPAVNDASQWEEIEGVHKHVINLLIELVKTLISEIEETSHLSTLVISPDEMNGFWEADFQSVKQNKHLDTETTPIDEISKE